MGYGIILMFLSLKLLWVVSLPLLLLLLFLLLLLLSWWREWLVMSVVMMRK